MTTDPLDVILSGMEARALAKVVCARIIKEHLPDWGDLPLLEEGSYFDVWAACNEIALRLDDGGHDKLAKRAGYGL